MGPGQGLRQPRAKVTASRALASIPFRLLGPGIILTSSPEASGPLPSSVLGLSLQLCDNDLLSLCRSSRPPSAHEAVRVPRSLSSSEFQGSELQVFRRGQAWEPGRRTSPRRGGREDHGAAWWAQGWTPGRETCSPPGQEGLSVCGEGGRNRPRVVD